MLWQILNLLRGFGTIYSEPKLTDKDLLKMAAMPFANTLTFFTVKNFEMSHESIEVLKKFPNLTRLMCGAASADDAFLVKLVGCLPNLVLLELNGLGKSGKVTERGVAELAKLPLRVLWLHFDRQLITPAVCRVIAEFPELIFIQSFSSFGDAELVTLGKCPKLQTLFLGGILSITDSGLNDFKPTSTLRRLEIKKASVSEKTVQKLAKALPQCQIVWSGGVVGPLDKSAPPPPSDDPGNDFPPADQPALLQAPFTKEQAEKARAEWAAFLKIPERKQIELPKGMKLEVVLIPPGQFRMGTEGNTKNEVAHDVTITKPFYMAVTETTQEQYEAVIGKNPSGFAPNGKFKDRIGPEMDTAKFPVETVTWIEADSYCKAIKVQLPTAAQWEYACRGGTTSPFHFGNSLNGTEANSNGNAPTPFGTMIGPNLERATKVGSYKPNGFGLFDMHGNVSEWCRDWYADSTVDLGDTDPERTTETADARRVERGGSWYTHSMLCTSGGRGGRPPGHRWVNIGFRVIVLP